MSASTLPILDPREATDHLLDARASLQDVRDSTLDGDKLNKPVTAAITALDEPMKILAVWVTGRGEQRRLDLEQLGEAS